MYSLWVVQKLLLVSMMRCQWFAICRLNGKSSSIPLLLSELPLMIGCWMIFLALALAHALVLMRWWSMTRAAVCGFLRLQSRLVSYSRSAIDCQALFRLSEISNQHCGRAVYYAARTGNVNLYYATEWVPHWRVTLRLRQYLHCFELVPDSNTSNGNLN